MASAAAAAEENCWPAATAAAEPGERESTVGCVWCGVEEGGGVLSPLTLRTPVVELL